MGFHSDTPGSESPFLSAFNTPFTTSISHWEALEYCTDAVPGWDSISIWVTSSLPALACFSSDVLLSSQAPAQSLILLHLCLRVWPDCVQERGALGVSLCRANGCPCSSVSLHTAFQNNIVCHNPAKGRGRGWKRRLVHYLFFPVIFFSPSHFGYALMLMEFLRILALKSKI